MNMMDECFRARMNVLTGRFPLREFREAFVKEMAEHGLVLIQGTAFDTTQTMTTGGNTGIVFNSERHVYTAMRLVERWGFDVERCDDIAYNGRVIRAVRVIFPQDYLRQRIGSDQLGRMYTRDRNTLHREGREGRGHLERRLERFVI